MICRGWRVWRAVSLTDLYWAPWLSVRLEGWGSSLLGPHGLYVGLRDLAVIFFFPTLSLEYLIPLGTSLYWHLNPVASGYGVTCSRGQGCDLPLLYVQDPGLGPRWGI